MALKDLREFVAPPTLDLPIGGKTYCIPKPNAKVGATVQQLMWLGEDAADADDATLDAAKDAMESRVAAAMLTDDQAESLYRQVLGPFWDQMADDGVTLDETKHAGLTVAIWCVYGEDAAEGYWLSPGASDAAEGEGDGQGEAQTLGKPDSRQGSEGAAPTTTSRASGSTTKAGSRSKPKPKKARRGSRSSGRGGS